MCANVHDFTETKLQQKPELYLCRRCLSDCSSDDLELSFAQSIKF